MIKKLQRKFVGIAILSLLAVLILVEGGINIINICQVNRKSEALLDMLLDNDGKFPEQNKMKPSKTQDREAPPPEIKRPEDEGIFGFRISAETPFETRYFSVVIPADGEAQADITHIASVAREEAAAFADEILKSRKSAGYTQQYRYKVKIGQDSTLIVFVDCGNDQRSIRNFAFISVLVGTACLLLVLILVILLSRRAIRPVIESVEKQKQFITDAGHEIKTPISIISANNEVIEMCQGESEWTRSIHNQVDRLSELVENLLTLSRLDEAGERIQMELFCVGAVVSEITEGFEPLIRARKLHLECQIDETLEVTGDAKSIRHLVSILMDNAVKYTPAEGQITVVLKGQGRHVELAIHNDCAKIPRGDLTRLFDRFYRDDQSRSRDSGGYGIGLSAAQAVVQAHHGKITAKEDRNGITFSVIL